MTTLNRRSLLAGAATVGALIAGGAISGVRAAAPIVGKQAPGFYRYKVGSIEVTVVTDGLNQFPLPDDFVSNMKKEEVQAWLKKHPRFVLHFVPTSSSWLNLVERWFSELSRQCIRRGAFFSVGDLKKAIREFLASWNEDPKPFVWTATVESIMEKLSRCRQTLEKIQPGCTLPPSRKKEQ